MKIRICFPGKMCPLPTLVSCVVARARRAVIERAAAAAMARPLLRIFSIVLISCLCAAERVSGQSEPAAAAAGEIQALKVGDRIPDELRDQYFPVVSADNSLQQMLSLGDFRDKLIILDFWATWCAPCISSLYKLDTLQKEFREELVVIPSSYEPEEKVRKFFLDKGWKLPTAFDETILRKYFPYRSLPHQVWIKDGKVLAIPDYSYANRENLNSIFGNKEIGFFNKKENIDLDFSEPLLIGGNGGDANTLIYQSMLTKRIDAFISGVAKKGRNSVLIYNHTLADLYQKAFLYDLPRYAQNSTRMVWQVPEEMRLDFTGEGRKVTGDFLRDKALYEWLVDNLYCYNLVHPLGLSEEKVYRYMQEDLNRLFGDFKNIHASLEKRKTRCIAIKRLPAYESIGAKHDLPNLEVKNGTYRYRGWSFERFLHSLSNIYSKKDGLPIENFTGIVGNVDMDLEVSSLGELEELNLALNRYGISATIEEEEIEVLVIDYLQ